DAAFPLPARRHARRRHRGGERRQRGAIPRRRHDAPRPDEAGRDAARGADRHQRHRPRRRPYRAAPGRALSFRLDTDVGGNGPPRHPPRLSGRRAVARPRRQPADPQHGDARRQRAAADAVQLFPRSQLDGLQQAQPRQRLRRARRSQPQTRRARHEQPVHRHLSRRFRAGPDRAGRRGGDRRRPRQQGDPVRRASPRARRHAADRDDADAGRADRRLYAAGRAVDAALAVPEGARPRILRVRAGLGGGGARPVERGRQRGAGRAWRRRYPAVALARGRSRADRAEPRRSRRPESRRRRLCRGTNPRRQRLQDRARQTDARPRPDASLSHEYLTVQTAQLKIGSPITRIDGRLKVTGEARYASDTPLGDPAYAVLATCAIARGRITDIDETEARAVPGVLDILTHRNIGGAVKKTKLFSDGGYVGTTIMPLGSDQVWHDGQIVAVVLAETFEAASDAASRLVVRYAAEEPAAGFDSAGATTVAAKDVSKTHEDPEVGDAATAFAAAPVKIDAGYSTPTQHHNPIELFTTSCAWSDGKLTA